MEILEKKANFQTIRKEEKKSILECQEKQINISSIVLDLLEELGFERQSEGTLYLEDVISTFYHERKAFTRGKKYFDFDDRTNNHYIFTKDLYECGLKTLFEGIDEAISKSYVSNETLNKIIYGIVNDIIIQYDRSNPTLQYQKK